MDHPEFQDFDFHQPSNIKGVKGARADINTHQDITNSWEDFHRDFPNANRAQIEAFSHHIDEVFYDHWFR
jgi:hypothetical protein